MLDKRSNGENSKPFTCEPNGFLKKVVSPLYEVVKAVRYLIFDRAGTVHCLLFSFSNLIPSQCGHESNHHNGRNF